MKPNKVHKRLAKIEAMITDLTERYSKGPVHIREALQDAKAAIAHVKEAVSSGMAKKAAADPKKAAVKKAATKAPAAKTSKKSKSMKKAAKKTAAKKGAAKKKAAKKKAPAPVHKPPAPAQMASTPEQVTTRQDFYGQE
jgi:hypothetical protein